MDREKYLARHTRYNNSVKGKARRARYEEKHPERKQWSEIMRIKARRR